MEREEAIKKVRQMSLPKETREILEALVPELREGENEKMAEMAIKAVLSPEAQSCIRSWGVNPDDVISWLEKQKEPVVDKEGMYYYLGGKFIYCGYPATEENPYDFAMSQQEKQKEQKPVEHHWEQMEWADIDFDEFTENVRHLIIDKLTTSSPSAKGGVSIDDKTAKEIANGILFFIGPQKPAEWKDRPANWDEEKEAKYQHELSYMPKPEKPAEWSEEDEEMLEYIIGDVYDVKQLYTTQEAKDMADKEIAWLILLSSNLKKRNEDVAKLCSNEWSEEDEKTLDDLLWLCDRWDEGINNVLPSKEAITKTRKMLKSLRPSWRPSEEQMDSLRDTIVQTKGYSYSVYLPELYEQLKKLKGGVAPMKDIDE